MGIMGQSQEVMIIPAGSLSQPGTLMGVDRGYADFRERDFQDVG
jgi:hypothetical protein